MHEDSDIIVVEKPAGVPSVPSEPGVQSLAQTVFAYCCAKKKKKKKEGGSNNDTDDDTDTAVTFGLVSNQNP